LKKTTTDNCVSVPLILFFTS